MNENDILQQLQELKKAVAELSTKRVGKNNIIPKSVKQPSIDGIIIFTGKASVRPTNGATEVQAWWSTDTHVLSIWDTTASVWRTVTLS